MRARLLRNCPTVVGLSVLAGSAITAAGLNEPAHAMPAGVWDRVAACESSGNWGINTGNGYFGGLQFAPSTWVEFGGRQYAPRADLATPRQQIEVARRVLAGQGPKAWPVCGKRAKLTKANGGATRAPLPKIGPVIRTVPAPVSPNPSTSRPPHTSYRVQPGDTLSAIAQRLAIPGGWRALWQLNRSHVPNPNVIFIGQSLRVS
jgi:nucleoid-associated protein YgaU